MNEEGIEMAEREREKKKERVRGREYSGDLME